MRIAPRIVIALALIGTAPMATEHNATAQEQGIVSIAAGQSLGVDALRQWDATVTGMEHAGNLAVMSRRSDAYAEGRTHEYLAQYHAGIPVHGGGVSRQLDPGGATVSLFGHLAPADRRGYDAASVRGRGRRASRSDARRKVRRRPPTASEHTAPAGRILQTVQSWKSQIRKPRTSE